jgi:hypothetical protein
MMFYFSSTLFYLKYCLFFEFSIHVHQSHVHQSKTTQNSDVPHDTRTVRITKQEFSMYGWQQMFQSFPDSF